MHLALCSDPSIRMFFNLDTAVGHGVAGSRTEDVLFVQYCFIKLARSARNPQSRRLFSQIRASGICDAALVACIRDYQTGLRGLIPATIVDGVVNVTHGGPFYRHHGAEALFAIVQMNVNLKRGNEAVWPRLDKDPECPPALGQFIRNALAGGLR